MKKVHSLCCKDPFWFFGAGPKPLQSGNHTIPAGHKTDCQEEPLMGEYRHPHDSARFSKRGPHIPLHDRRRHTRKRCFIEVSFSVRDYSYKAYMQDISEGGAYLRSNKAKRLSPRENVLLNIPLRILGDQLKGKIAWVEPHGMGVEFQLPEPDQAESKREGDSEDLSKTAWKKTGKIKPRRLHWEPSTSVDVSYRVYWSKSGTVDYNSDCADVGKVTEVTLPDDIPSFPLLLGEIALGVSAVSQSGNESEIAETNVHFDFTVPGAPGNLRIKDS